MPLSRYALGQCASVTQTPVIGTSGVMATNTSKKKAIPAVLIKQGGQLDKLILLPKAATGSSSQCSIPRRNELIIQNDGVRRDEKTSSSTVIFNEDTVDRGVSSSLVDPGVI